MSPKIGRFVAACKDRGSRVGTFFSTGVWELEVDECPWYRRIPVNLLRFVLLLGRGFSEHRLGLHASGLTLISRLSLVPILMRMLLLTKPCGMYEWAKNKLRTRTDQMIETFFEQKGVEKTKVESIAVSMIAPADEANAEAGRKFGAQARELRDQIMGQVDEKIEKFNFGVMAIVGFLVLAYTVISTFGQVEASMNEIWHVRKGRSLWKRFLMYCGTLMVMPLLMALAMSMPVLRMVRQALDATLGATSYTKWAGDAIISLLDSELFSFTVTLVFLSLLFAFLFWMMPKRRVQPRAALEGGLFTAVALNLWLRICTVLQFGIAKTGAAYGSFALIPILVIWISFNWRIILLGSNMAYAFQCIHNRVRDLPDVDE